MQNDRIWEMPIEHIHMTVEARGGNCYYAVNLLAEDVIVNTQSSSIGNLHEERAEEV